MTLDLDKVRTQDKILYRGRSGRTWPLTEHRDEGAGEKHGSCFFKLGDRGTEVKSSERSCQREDHRLCSTGLGQSGLRGVALAAASSEARRASGW